MTNQSRIDAHIVFDVTKKTNMKKIRILKIIVILAVFTVGAWFYLTEFQKYRIRALVENVRSEIVSGRMSYLPRNSLESVVMNATLPSVEKYGEQYMHDYSRSGDPEKFATGIMLDRPDLRWANGIGKSYTIPMCIMLLEGAKRYPPPTRFFMEEIACTLLPKATGEFYGIDGGKFIDSDEERLAAIEQWRDWFESNKIAVLQDDQRRKAAVGPRLGGSSNF